MKIIYRLILSCCLAMLCCTAITGQGIIVSEGTVITQPGGSLMFKGALLNNGTINTSGDFILLSGQDGTSLIDGRSAGVINGEIVMQRWFEQAFGYRYLSSPFTSASVSELADDIDLGDPFPNLWRYDESMTGSGWIDHTGLSGTLVPMSGYSANLGFMDQPVTVDIKGVPNDGAMTVTLYNHNNTLTDGFNLVGNPYPSPIDWDAPEGWARTNIDDAVYYFRASITDPYGGTYSTWMNGYSSDGIVNNIIPSMQGFFVHVSDGTYPVSATLALNNKARVNDLTHSFTKSEEKGSQDLVRLTAGFSDDPASSDPAVIYVDEKATFGFDGQLDALKLYNTDIGVPSFYSFGCDGSRLSINSIPEPDTNCTVRLGLRTERDGDVVFNIKTLEGSSFLNTARLTDKLTGEVTDLAAGITYKVYLPAGDYTERFYLSLTNQPTEVPEIYGSPEWGKIYHSRGILKVEIFLPDFSDGILTVCNLSGQLLFRDKVEGPGYHEFTPLVRDGIYLVRLSSGRTSMTKKVFIQKI